MAEVLRNDWRFGSDSVVVFQGSGTKSRDRKRRKQLGVPSSGLVGMGQPARCTDRGTRSKEEKPLKGRCSME